jgi:hypothetical protein
MWPTPKTGDRKAGQGKRYGPGQKRSNLNDAVAREEAKMWPTPRTAQSSQYPEDPEVWKGRRGGRNYETDSLGNAVGAAEAEEKERAIYPTPTASGSRPSEGNIRLLRKLVLNDELPLEEAVAMLNGTSPFSAWGRTEKGDHKGIPAYTGPWPDHLKHLEDRKLYPTPRNSHSSWIPEDPETWEPRRGHIRSDEDDSLSHAALVADEEARDMWPAPVASDQAGSRRETARAEGWKSNPGETLTDAAWKEEGFWRTPTAREYKGASPKSWTERAPKDGDPTPTLTDQVNSKQGRSPGRLNADWVEWLMGWPIGWTSTEPMEPGAFEHWFEAIWRGPWWASEPDVKRIIKKQPNQGARLKSLGNGQVSLCAAAAFLSLLETVWQVDEVIRRSSEEMDMFDLLGL